MPPPVTPRDLTSLLRPSVGLALLAATQLVAAGACTRPKPRDGHAIYAAEEPPEPLTEIVPLPPQQELVWLSGYWHWSRGRYHWVRGHYAPRPAPEWRWQRSGWVRTPYGYRFYPGRWVLQVRSVRYVRGAPARVEGEEYQALEEEEAAQIRQRLGPHPPAPAPAPTPQ